MGRWAAECGGMSCDTLTFVELERHTYKQHTAYMNMCKCMGTTETGEGRKEGEREGGREEGTCGQEHQVSRIVVERRI